MVRDPDNLIANQLAEANSYLRELVSHKRRDDLREALSDPEKRRAYELSDGTRTSSNVRNDGNLSKSPRTIQRWWQDWIDRGLAEAIEGASVRARYDPWVINVGDQGG